jgi:hypothetical protein
MKREDEFTDKRNENQKAKKWNEIMENYDGEPILGTKFIAYERLIPEAKDLKFRNIEERAADIAQNYTLDCLLSMYATGQQVQPHKLMEFIMLSIRRLQNAEIREFEQKKKEELLHILPSIDHEMITTPGGCAMKKIAEP